MASLNLEQFVRQLTESGLLTSDEMASFTRSLPAGQRPADADSLARALVQAGRLTQYQASAAYLGKAKGLVFGEYRVLDKIGQGGMGLVLKAEHRRMKRVVAIKVLPAATMKSPEAVRRFYREVEAAAKLSHPNIVTAYDASEHQGMHYLVMEYVDGRDLASIIKQHGAMPVRQAVECVLQAARGLHYAHEQGIIHRDIKPGNLLLDKKGTVKILDMGLARIEQSAAEEAGGERLTRSGQIMGTCDYMAPEQALDTHSVDGRADIYSLGCTLYRLLTGKTPYQADSFAKLFLAHLNDPIPRLCEARPDVPAELESIYGRMMAKRAEDRPPSMGALVVELERFLGLGRPARDEEDSFSSEAFSFLREVTQGASATRLAAQVQVEDTLEHGSLAEAATDDRVKLLTAVRTHKRLSLGVAASLVGLIVFAGVVITIRSGDKTTTIRVPDGSHVEIGKDGRVDVTRAASGRDDELERARRRWGLARPERESAEEQPAGPRSKGGFHPELAEEESDALDSEPRPGRRPSLSPVALVGEPAPIPGVRSWSVETACCRGPAVAWSSSPDGNRLGVGGEDGTVRLFDAHDGRCLRLFVKHKEAVRALAWSPDGRQLATTDNRSVFVWEADSGKFLQGQPVGENGGGVLAWSPKGRLLAWVQGQPLPRQQLAVWDPSRPAPPRLSEERIAGVRSLSWSSDETRLACGNSKGTVQVLNVPELTVVREIRVAPGGQTFVAWSPDGRSLATTAQAVPGIVQFWDAEGGEEPRPLKCGAPGFGGAFPVVWSPDAKTLAAIGSAEDTNACLFNAETGAVDKHLALGRQPFRWAAWSADGQRLTLAGPLAARVYDLQTWQSKAFGIGVPGVSGPVCFSSDSRQLAYRGRDGVLGIWDFAAGRLPRLLGTAGNSRVAALAWSADDRLLMEKHDGPEVDIWDAKSGRTQIRITAPGSGCSAAISPDGMLVATGGEHVDLWDTSTGKLVRTISLAAAWPAFSPDGQHLAVCCEKTVALLETQSGKQLHELSTPTAPAWLAWSPDGSRLATAGEEGNPQVLVWDVARAKALRSLSMQGHGPVRAIRWRDNVQTLDVRAGCYHGVLWDVETGNRLRQPFFCWSGTDADLSPDGCLEANRKGGAIRIEDANDRHVRASLAEFPEGELVVGPDGHCCAAPGVEKELRYVVETESVQESLTPDEFARKHGWKDSPAQAGTEGPPPAANSIDLLKRIDLSRDAVKGDWKWEGERLLTPRHGQDNRLQVSVPLPEEYSLLVVAERKGAGLSLNLGFVVGGSQGTVCVDGFTNRGTALECIDGKAGKENGTLVAGTLLPVDQRVRLVLNVRKTGLQFFCDGREILAWSGDYRRFSLYKFWVVPDPHALVLGAQAPFVIHRYELTPLVH